LEALVVGALGLGITQGLMFTALAYTSAVNAGIIFAVSPIITMVLARIVIGEDLGPWQAIGSLVAFIGIVVIAIQGSIATLLSLDLSGGDLLVLAYAAIPGGAVMYLLFNWSVDVLGASRAGGLLYSQMVFTAILAWLILGEPIEWYQYAGAGLIIAGVVLVTLFKPTPAAIRRK
ncbi:MAG: DMT family transporter, partial [Bauldia sp.]